MTRSNFTRINTCYIFCLLFLSKQEPARAMFLFTFLYFFRVFGFKIINIRIGKKENKNKQNKEKNTVTRFLVTPLRVLRITLFRVYIASSEHGRGWEDSRHLCKPETHAFGKYFSKVCANLKRHKRVYILSSKHTFRPTRARVVSQ